MHDAKIIAVTQPTISQIHPFEAPMSVDEFIAYVARVSNPSNQNNTITANKLLKYLAKNKHWSPFEMVNIVMEINTTRDIARQILRHRSFSFQEFSQRYADPTKDLGYERREARLQDTKNRQNSIDIDVYNNMDHRELNKMWEEKQIDIQIATRKIYEWAITNGIAKEQARAVLPEGMIVSRMYMNGTLRSWIHYCQLRMDPGTQKEHREIAIDAWYKITERFPSLKDSLDIGV
jgi:thymidylate synthase (FAD)